MFDVHKYLKKSGDAKENIEYWIVKKWYQQKPELKKKKNGKKKLKQKELLFSKT